jgi:hypothetical protein
VIKIELNDGLSEDEPGPNGVSERGRGRQRKGSDKNGRIRKATKKGCRGSNEWRLPGRPPNPTFVLD